MKIECISCARPMVKVTVKKTNECQQWICRNCGNQLDHVKEVK